MDDWRDHVSRGKIWASSLRKETLNEVWQTASDAVRGITSSTGVVTDARRHNRQNEEVEEATLPRSQPSSHNGALKALPVLLTAPSIYLSGAAADAGSLIATSLTSRLPQAHRSTARYYGRRALRLSSRSTSVKDPKEAAFDPYCSTERQTELSQTAMEYAMPYRVAFNQMEEWVKFHDPESHSEGYQAYKGRSHTQRQRDNAQKPKEECFYLDDLEDQDEALSVDEAAETGSDDEEESFLSCEDNEGSVANLENVRHGSFSRSKGKRPVSDTLHAA